MTVRKGKRRNRPLAEVIDTLPDRFLHITFQVDGNMSGFRSYFADLQQYLSAECGYHVGQKDVTDVAAALGVSPAAWFGAALGAVPPASEVQYENRSWK
jgi:hypothetical protein